MSRVHTARLETIRREFAAAKASLGFALSHSTATKAALPGVETGDIALALRNVEDTYFLRLTAEAEAICREHLAAFPGIAIRPSDGYDSLINKAARKLDPTNNLARMPGYIADAARDLRPHRNSQAHGQPLSETRPPFSRALTALSQFVYVLP